VDNITRYTGLQQKLHWAVVVLVALQYLLQGLMKSAMSLEHDGLDLGLAEFLVVTVHTWGGAAVGAIMVYRLYLRLQRPVPVGAGQLRGTWLGLAQAVHWLLYAVLFFMAATGILHYYFELHLVAQWHEWGEWLLLALIVLHSAAALVHHFYKKDVTLRQMWGSRPPH